MKNKNKQKTTTAIATTSFPTNAAGLVAPLTPNFVAGDRGCLPAVGAANTASSLQATNAQLTLGAANGATTDVVAANYAQATVLLCSTSGTCCTTDLCNTMSRVEMSFVAMFVTIALAVFGVYNGF